ncbi:hypothetical protein [Marinospirillum alkaliphilum]|uniref:Porin n=1 Tax=Marinospirillum alkaliphilum DSM 21637 TaxID=1122209 RepID=A0A1K1TGG6_9GAMM|nr:hypothetical protein [Marinospirillum alkaliphilum]SFW99664.1 hypothetical protein SAMN02745752_00139 [Marinospirillum alkaliphilum DSM 21637]
MKSKSLSKAPLFNIGKLAALAVTPLAAAMFAASAHAVTFQANDNTTVGIGGIIFAQAVWANPDNDADRGNADADTSFGINQATTRLNFDIRTRTEYGEVRVLLEDEVSGATPGRRHRALFWGDYVAGWTWSNFADFTGGGEVLAPVPLAAGSSWASRNFIFGRNFNLGDAGSFAVSLEDRQLQGDNGTAVPDLTANYRATFNGIGLHVGAQMYQLDKFDGSGDSEAKTRFIVGVRAPVTDDLTLRASFITDEDNYDGVAVSAQYKLTDRLRTNLVVEQIMHSDDAMGTRGAGSTVVRRPADRPKGLSGPRHEDHQKVFVNAIYRTQLGVELGGEVEIYNDDDYTDTLLTFQARYGF